jgi:hypothetical protein
MAILNNQLAFYCFTKTDFFNQSVESSTFSFDNCYSSSVFHSIMPNTGATGISTASHAQVKALQQLDSSIKIDQLTAGNHTIQFGKGKAVLLRTVTVKTPIGLITFHMVPTNTPFLFCLKDMD